MNTLMKVNLGSFGIVLLLSLTLLPLGGVGLAQAGELDPDSIDDIAHTVVQIVAIENDEIVSTGSGTVVDPSGLIFTNAHVVENADELGIAVLDDINELPEPRYFASVVEIYEDFDFAVLQIDRDIRGRDIDPEDLDLPSMTVDPDVAVTRGDKVYVFGYPGIGDGFLVLTEGTITTIQNDDFGDERLPRWYQIDAEIAPGNSGGLVVNADGAFIGIPTAVASDDRTLARLGAVLPIGTIDVIMEQEGGARVQTDPDQEVSISITDIAYDANDEGRDEVGMRIFMDIRAVGFRGQPLRVALLFYDEDAQLIESPDAPREYRAADDILTVQTVLEPRFNNTEWEDYSLWIPYSSFPRPARGQAGGIEAVILLEQDREVLALSEIVDFEFDGVDSVTTNGGAAQGAGEFTLTITRIEHNVAVEGRAGMRVYTDIQVEGAAGRDVRVQISFYWEGGDAIPNRSDRDQPLMIEEVLTPRFDTTQWNDYFFWVPYSSFPSGLRGTQNAIVEAQIGFDGEAFALTSNQLAFALTYPE